MKLASSSFRDACYCFCFIVGEEKWWRNCCTPDFWRTFAVL